MDYHQKRLENLKFSQRYRYELYRDQDAQIMINHSVGATESHFPHFHRCIEILYVEYGEMWLRLGDTDHILTAGQYAAIPSYMIHDCVVGDDDCRWCMLIPVQMIPRAMRFLEGKAFDNCIMEDDGFIFALFRDAYHIVSGTVPFAEHRQNLLCREALSGIATAIVLTAIAACGLREDSTASEPVINALKYIHLHFREDIRVPKLAATVLCPQKVLSDGFHRAFGMTVTAYINHIRAIDVHWSLQDDAALTLEEAAERAGFGSVRSMLRAYKAEYGCTPTENR